MNRIGIIAAAAVFTISTACMGQRGYHQYKQEEGLKIGTKWGKAKDENGVRKTALLIGVENTNREPVTYSYTINFYYEGMLRETGQMAESCVDGLKSKIGKLNGVFFIPTKFTEEQLKSADFYFTIEEIEIEKVDACPN